MKKSEDLLRERVEFESDFRESKKGFELEPFEMSIDPELMEKPRSKKKRTQSMQLDSSHKLAWPKKRKVCPPSGIYVPLGNRY